MSASRRSNKVSLSDTTSTGKTPSAPKGKSSHGASKDAGNSRGKSPQTKPTALTSMAKGNQQKLQTLTPEERELFESLKKNTKKPAETKSDHITPKSSVNKSYKTPSPIRNITAKKNGKTSAQSKTEPPPQEKDDEESEGESEDESVSLVKSSAESPKKDETEEKMVIEEVSEEQEKSNLDLSVPDPISGFIRDQQGRLTPRSEIFSFEGKSGGKGSRRKEEVNPFDEPKSGQKNLLSNTRKLPTILDAVLEDSDYEIQINITQIDEEGDMSQDIRGREVKDGSNKKKHASGEKRMLKGIGSTGGYWGNILGDIGKHETSSTDSPVKRKIAYKDNEITSSRKRGGEKEDVVEENHNVIRVIVPEGVEHEEEESQLKKKKKNVITSEDDQERKIKEKMMLLTKSDMLNESMFDEQIEIMEENKDLLEDEDLMEVNEQNRRALETSRMEEEEEMTQRKRNIKEMLDMLVGDRSENTEEKIEERLDSKQSSLTKMQVERSNRNEVEIEEEPMTGEAKKKEINAEIAKEKNALEAKASENEESDEELERIGDLEEIEDIRSPGHTDDSVEEIERQETKKKKGSSGVKASKKKRSNESNEGEKSVVSEELDKLEELAEIEEIRPAQGEASKGEIDREIEQIEQEGNLGNIEDSEAEQSSIAASPRSGNDEREKPKNKIPATLIVEEEPEEEEEEEIDDEKLFEESNKDPQKMLNRESVTKTANIAQAEKSPEEQEEIKDSSAIYVKRRSLTQYEIHRENRVAVTGGTQQTSVRAEYSQDITVPRDTEYGKEGDSEEVEEEGEEENESIFLGGSQKVNEESHSEFHYENEKEDSRGLIVKKKKVEREEDKEWDIDEEEEKAANEEEEELPEEELVIEEEEEERVGNVSRETGSRNQTVNQSNIRDSTIRKEYTAYEDWRLIEAMKWYIQRKGEDGMQSKKTWETIKDPLTGKRLLNNERTGESMRNRIRRTLNVLEEEDKEYIRNYMQTHSEEEAKTQYCRFEKDKWSGQKKFKGIFSQLNFNPQTLTKKKTEPENSRLAASRVIIENRNLSKKKVGRVQDAFERGELSDDIENVGESQSTINAKLQRLIDFPQEFTNPKMLTTSVIINRARSPSQSNNGEQHYTFENEGQRTSYKVTQYNPKIKKIGRENNQEEILPPDTESLPKSSVRKDSGKSSKKRKDYEDKELSGRHNCDLKKVKMNDYFEQKSLMISDAFKTRKHSEPSVTPKDDLMIFLDLEEGFRQFVQDKDRLNEEADNEWLEMLPLLATRYKLPLKKVGALFNQVSCDLDDLELYLKTKRPELLWDAEEDSDLLTENEIGLRYLRRAKGEERMEKRRKYLMNS